jgi:hypothetical protein
MERGVTHKVLRRGRVSAVLEQVMRARVREALACARSCERWASPVPHAWISALSTGGTVNLLTRVLAFLSAACVLPAMAIAASPALPIPGEYRLTAGTGVSGSLTLLKGGDARYELVWINGDATEVPEKFSVTGKRAASDYTVVLTLPFQERSGTIQYEYSWCISRQPFGKRGCSPGLAVQATDMPKKYVWTMWKEEGLERK